MPLFLPTPRQTNWLLIVGFLAVGEALYLRYLVIEHAPVSLACQAEPNKTWLCMTFTAVIALYNKSVFGWVALAAAGMGLVLHNGGLAGLAAALLILSLARPAPAPE